MKLRFLKNLVFTVLVALLITSCLFKDEDEKEYTAAEEKQLREAYLNDLVANDHDIDTTENGVYYVILEEGEEEGAFAQSGDSLVVGYAGYFIDGSKFDSSKLHYQDGKYRFVLDVDPMIEGWEEGLKMMKEGARMQFIIPSELAYGSEGYLTIPPYQTLVFVIELFEIIPL